MYALAQDLRDVLLRPTRKREINGLRTTISCFVWQRGNFVLISAQGQ